MATAVGGRTSWHVASATVLLLYKTGNSLAKQAASARYQSVGTGRQEVFRMS